MERMRQRCPLLFEEFCGSGTADAPPGATAGWRRGGGGGSAAAGAPRGLEQALDEALHEQWLKDARAQRDVRSFVPAIAFATCLSSWAWPHLVE